MERTVIGVTPFGEPGARLAAAVSRAGGLGVLDLGAGGRAARDALEQLSEWAPGTFGVRVPAGCALRPEELPAPDATGPHTVLLAPGAPWRPGRAGPRTVLAEVCSLSEARAAVRAGAAGIVARGSECGGPAGRLSTYVLLQQLLADARVTVPVWACGGIGAHTAAAAVLGGAAGVVLDVQLALLDEACAPPALAELLRTLDGSETVVVDGRRILDPRRPGLPPLLREQPLPLGQDAFLARRFAERHRTAAAAVRAVRESVDRAVRAAHAPRALRPGSPMSRSLGTALPVAQGPMTRVSDQAGFAAAVAGAGGLPFIALALAGPADTRAVLAETRAALGERPWGVGILGFVPEDVRTAQLAAVRDARPSHVIIAGGRPSQAAELEADGIPAFLHVPSPGLLAQFLAAGARRFVFEGAECGGHIGPRNSFPLWEAQLAVLDDFLDARDGRAAPDPVEVLFAGGVHDERSAAMVAALAAGAGGRGVLTGLLMGTAYLFTEEAVECGAIRPVYQRQVLAAEDTTVLHNGPGHAIRCVPSPFGDTYRALKAELVERGVPESRAREELERLSLGRLRIAGKGIERVGEELVHVDERRQLDEGMFMAGEVAVLRGATTTVAALHHQVGEAAAAFYERRAAVLAEAAGAPSTTDGHARAPEPLDIAVIGMACMFPQAPDLAAFWANVLAGTDAVTEVPADRWDPALYHGEAAAAHDVTTSKWGGFLPRIPFDPLRYGIPPASLAAIEPVQLLSLEAARRALADAGYDRRDFPRDRTCVVFGAEAGSDTANATTLRAVLPSYLGRLPEELAAQLPVLTEDSFPGMLANVISGRIANRLDLGGANYTVDAACASSLAALDAACKELATGAADLALCGGADLHNGINDYLLFSSVHALSPTGRCRPFDAGADGIALGEGVACVVLKRLADAERDGDRVYAVVKSVGSAGDGRSLGLTAPRPEGQRAALERAYRQARTSPADVGLVEAHGTGTVVGDRTELATLTEVFEEAGAAPGGCVVGSVKSQIGHTKCAAGLAGLIKTALALRTGVRPPTLHVRRPNPAWRAEDSPFVFHDRALPWPGPAGRRVAGVSAFGFGGTNFHAVLGAHAGAAPPRHGHHDWPAELLVLRSPDDARELLRLTGLNDRAGRPWRLRDLALTAARRSGTQPPRAAVVADSLDALPGLLRAVLDAEPAPGVLLAGAPPADPARTPAGKVAFLFPGQGSQRPGMLADLFTAFPETQRRLRGAPAGDLFPPAAFDPGAAEAARARLADTRRAQPALGAVCLAVQDVLRTAGVRPDMAAGHSYGELVALCAAGALSPGSLMTLSIERGEAIVAAAGDDPGAMAAVAAAPDKADALLAEAGLAGRVVVANHNAPAQSVVSGPTADVERAVAVLRDTGVTARRLPVSCAFHSPVVAGAVDRFGRALATHEVRAPEIPVWSNVTAARYPLGSPDIRRTLAAQIASPVRFAEQIEAMYEAGARVFVEAGPGTVLTGLVRQVLDDRPHVAVPFEPRADAGLRGHLEALARLAVSGVPVAAARLLAGRGAVVADPEAVPARPGWTVDGHLVRTADGEPLPGALRPARRLAPAASPGPAVDTPVPVDESALVSEFLRTSREMVAAQKDVLLTYLGARAGGRATPDTPATAPLPPSTPPPAPPGTATPPKPAPEPPHAPSAAPDVLATVLAVISERTGYPVEIVEPDLDLEADLSVDSIKRTEIVGELGRRLGAATGRGLDVRAMPDAELEDLLRCRTAAAIADWLTTRLDTGPPPDTGRQDSEPAAPANAPPGRYLLRRVPLAPAPAEGSLHGQVFAVPGQDTPVARALVDRLRALGAVATRGDADPEAHPGPLDGAIHLDALAPGAEPVLPAAFPLFKALLGKKPRRLLCARPTGDPAHAAGLGGFFRTVAREHPGTLARVVALDPASPAEALADALVGELLATDPDPVVLRTPDGARYGTEPCEAPLARPAAAVPEDADPLLAEAAAAGLGPGSVVLLAGGARGIAAHLTTALAAAGCHLELLGRTVLPADPEDPALAAASDEAALRAALAARGGLRPALIGQETRRILARREVAATLAEAEALGSRPHYRAVDLRDAAAVREAVEDVHARHGRIDAVVHAAGVIEDRLLADKTPESFERVHGTKTEGARALLAALRALPEVPGLLVLFGSVAAVTGNRGQADYAAANDALATLGRQWRETTGGRALTVHWGPWAPTAAHTGMVTPELGREYARRGVGLIDPREGVLALLREIAGGDAATDEVVHTASGW
ncbi:polyketide synthase [Streptomyces cinnamoneus]|uniref:Polyketide synthase n=1 Tax=Streptomyces cinnamoneus TaxID=53446 RepID=A0A2G1XNJ8_STRCJ|nr:type I polyketide synthase [Streptomyces cinnamoneus]PHQ52793.1 polyketide synthase [Streptomyces cinnamoneus]PPT11895.1 KR domain-containing protein [Streptomyces cinnamoneus]